MPWIVEEIARRTLKGMAWSIFGDGAGHLQVQLDTSLLSLDQHLVGRWEVPWSNARSLTASPHGLLFLDGPRIQRIDSVGAVSTVAIAPALFGGDDVEGRVLACLDDGFVLGGVSLSGVGRVLRIDESGGPMWPSVQCGAAYPQSAVRSGDRLLVPTLSPSYTHWGHLGPALLLDVRDGALIAILRGEHGAAFGGGSFLLGLEGYDVFDTWLYGPDGSLRQKWRSDGHYVLDPGGSVRVVEGFSRHVDGARVARLALDGSIERGPKQENRAASAPVTLSDGTIVFMDGGTLVAVDRALKASTLAALRPSDVGEESLVKTMLLLEGDILFAVLCERLPNAHVSFVAHCCSLRLAER